MARPHESTSRSGFGAPRSKRRSGATRASHVGSGRYELGPELVAPGGKVSGQWAIEAQQLARLRMMEPEMRRVERHAGRIPGGSLAALWVAEHGVADGGAVAPNLMR